MILKRVGKGGGGGGARAGPTALLFTQRKEVASNLVPREHSSLLERNLVMEEELLLL